MADGRHFENSYLAISARPIVRLTRNLKSGNRIARIKLSRDQNGKFRKFKMTDGRNFENGFIAISQPYIIRLRLNLLRRCKFDSKNGHVIKSHNFAYSKWQTAAILKIVFWQYLSDLLSY